MTKEIETTKPMVLCLTVVRVKRRISSIMRICETRKALYFGPSIGAIGMSLFANATFCRDDSVVVMGTDASPAGVWQIQPATGKFWINWRRDRTSGRIGRICSSAARAQADRANPDGRKRDGGRKGTAGSGLDLRCRVRYIAWPLPFTSFTPN